MRSNQEWICLTKWITKIVGYGVHGFGKEALRLFEQMQHCGISPDHVTFVGVLSACCHSGLVACNTLIA